MANNGTNRGGSRIGSRWKKKSLVDKLAEGNPGKRKLEVIEFNNMADLNGQIMPQPREMLSEVQKDGRTLMATEIYEMTMEVGDGQKIFNFGKCM